MGGGSTDIDDALYLGAYLALPCLGIFSFKGPGGIVLGVGIVGAVSQDAPDILSIPILSTEKIMTNALPSSAATRAVIERHWKLANERNWQEFALLLATDLQYHTPMTRERIHSGAGYLDLFVTWPGNWRAEIEELICEEGKAACRITFLSDGESMTGISFFTLSTQGQITSVTEFWPEPYEPPARMSMHMLRY